MEGSEEEEEAGGQEGEMVRGEGECIGGRGTRYFDQLWFRIYRERVRD